MEGKAAGLGLSRVQNQEQVHGRFPCSSRVGDDVDMGVQRGGGTGDRESAGLEGNGNIQHIRPR